MKKFVIPLIYIYMKTINLSQGKVALVDDEDFERVSQFKWYYNSGYASRLDNHKRIYLHRFIMNAPSGKTVDHKDGNPLDNRKENLRFCNQSENCRNRKPLTSKKLSKYKGVSIISAKKVIKSGEIKCYSAWRAYIFVDGKQVYLGRFKTEIEAAKAYDQGALKYYKEFAKLNFPEDK